MAIDSLQRPSMPLRGINTSPVAPRPQTLAETGIPINALLDLTEKHLFEGGVLTIKDLVQRMAMAGLLIEELLALLRREGRVEVRAQTPNDPSIRLGLTERGRGSALAALAANGYVGPVPVTPDVYAEVIRKQSVRSNRVTRAEMRTQFADVVIDPHMLDRLGPALNSGKAIFVYGNPGTGKTYVTQRLARVFDDTCLIPHAIAVGDTVIRIYDPAVHTRIESTAANLMLNQGHDPRFVLCRRPVVITGGELTADALEVQYDVATRQYRAPLQLKANGGMFILDDLGRQRVPPEVVLNRWIVPMEEGVDHLSLQTGQHFSVPFDVVLVFSTNLSPSELVDDAFLRRIGYKIRFDSLREEQYHAIWRGVCENHDLRYEPEVCQYVIERWHRPTGTALLPCHPRDLIRMALDHAIYMQFDEKLCRKALDWAWNNYFVSTHASTSS
ncbi:MAG: AAA family ATPase [Steroidobacteraceae bacterium]